MTAMFQPVTAKWAFPWVLVSPKELILARVLNCRPPRLTPVMTAVTEINNTENNAHVGTTQKSQSSWKKPDFGNEQQ